MEYKAFLSYSTKDIPNVDALRGFLQFPDVECFGSESECECGMEQTADPFFVLTVQPWLFCTFFNCLNPLSYSCPARPIFLFTLFLNRFQTLRHLRQRQFVSKV
jgi:hypothetical protein